MVTSVRIKFLRISPTFQRDEKCLSLSIGAVSHFFLMEARHSAPFRPLAAPDQRCAKGEEKKEGRSESLEFNLHSILIPIRYREFPFLWFTSYCSGGTGTLSVLRKRDFFFTEGQIFIPLFPVHTDVASSSIKSCTINNPSAPMIHSLSILS